MLLNKNLLYIGMTFFISLQTENKLLLPSTNAFLILGLKQQMLAHCAKESIESIEHLFIQCRVGKIARNVAESTTGIDINYLSLTLALDARSPEDLDFLTVCLTELNLTIWRARNRMAFENSKPDPVEILTTYKFALKTRILSDYSFLSPEDGMTDPSQSLFQTRH
jgi:hypothetical protein